MRGLCFLTRPLAASNEIGEDRGLETSLAEMRKVTDGDDRQRHCVGAQIAARIERSLGRAAPLPLIAKTIRALAGTYRTISS